MGQGCTKAASDTMGRLIDACMKDSGSQNMFTSHGRQFFWEYDPEDHDDGRITGQVLGSSHSSMTPFTITHDGRLVGGHPWMREMAKKGGS